ncbi:hypothetical protein DUI87_12198 [Hirundo rustica rustica]|uniref:RNase H type-1 domain-containing protein n=1 Tax=Hirundo rustica rustica TaxID=333673 RepID=A0A3M0KCW2_HIRRU|nr:hypothetical protein DUI87_12198 [Hirundo rustica rustica]
MTMKTQNPDWDDIQVILDTRMDSAEKEMVLRAARERTREDIRNGLVTFDYNFPTKDPLWDPNDPSGVDMIRLKKYQEQIQIGVQNAMPKTMNWSKLYEIRQEGKEYPTVFLERLKEAARKHTDPQTDTEQAKVQLALIFLGQSQDDIRKKITETGRGELKNLDKLLEVAWKSLRISTSCESSLGWQGGVICGSWTIYGLIAKPLYEAQKTQPFTWGKPQKETFLKLKEALTAAPALGLPDLSKDFQLFEHKRMRLALGVLTQLLGSWKRLVGYFSKQLDNVIMTEQDNVTLKTTNLLNPALFLGTTTEEGPLEHDCVEAIKYTNLVQEDLKDFPLEQPEWELFTDGSSFVKNGTRYAGYAVIISTVVEVKALPSNTSVQRAELVALTRALELSEGKKVNIWTDSKYAFGVVHVHGAQWKERELLSPQGQVDGLARDTQEGFKEVNVQLQATTKMTLQNQLALDMLLLKKHGVCGFLKGQIDYCCIHIPNITADVEYDINQLKQIQHEAQEEQKDLTTSWLYKIFKGSGWNVTLWIKSIIESLIILLVMFLVIWLINNILKREIQKKTSWNRKIMKALTLDRNPHPSSSSSLACDNIHDNGSNNHGFEDEYQV